MGLRKAALVLLVLLISGCASSRGMPPSVVDEAKVKSFAEVYRRAKEAGLSLPQGVLGLGADMGMEKPYVPVYEPPRVVKVWVPAHVALQDKDVMVAGHWTFVVVTPAHWFIEDDNVSQDTPVVMPGMPYKES
ncbi:MAG: hypothetical protein V2A70_07390 [Candidatus Omnitrophota bacterium]